MLTVSDNHIVLGGGGSGGGSGDVVGPASSTDNAIARFDGATGRQLQNSVVTIDDAGAITINGVTTVQPTLINGVAGTLSIGSTNTTNTGVNNQSYGAGAGGSRTTGTYSIAQGASAGYSNTVGSNWIAQGYSAGFSNTVGRNWIAQGTNAGRYTSTGNLTVANNTIHIGYNSKSLADNATNEIVIGANAVGNGNNTVTLGDSVITGTYLRNPRIIGTLTDSTGSDGVDGQVLKKVGGLVLWANP